MRKWQPAQLRQEPGVSGFWGCFFFWGSFLGGGGGERGREGREGGWERGVGVFFFWEGEEEGGWRVLWSLRFLWMEGRGFQGVLGGAGGFKGAPRFEGVPGGFRRVGSKGCSREGRRREEGGRGVGFFLV